MGRIGVHGLNAENIAACRFLNNLGHILIVAQHLTVDGHGAVVHIVRHGEIDDQGFAVCRRRRSRQVKPFHSVDDCGLADSAGEAATGLPVTLASHPGQQRTALAQVEVQKGITVLPLKSLSVTKLLTGHAAMPHQMG